MEAILENSFILVSDKDEEMRRMLQAQVQDLGRACVQAASLAEIREAVATQSVLAWVTDSVLAEYPICDMIREVKTQSPRLKVLVLGAEPDGQKYLDAGADRYLSKPYDRVALMTQLKSMLRPDLGSNARSAETLSLGELVLNPESFDVYCGAERAALTPSEFRLLHALMLKKDTVLTRDQLIEAVQGTGIVVIDRAVDTHMASLRKKLGPHGECLETVRGVGYRISEVGL